MQQDASEDAPPKQRVQDEIRKDIILGALPPGTRVTETALASKYGISRVPVREALRALEAEGFVESKPYAGSTVSKIPVDDADDLFFVREALESATARRAARRAAAQFDSGAPSVEWWQARKVLAGVLDEGDAAVAQNRLDLLPELNMRFHLGVAELSGSSSLTALLRQISGKIEWLYATDVNTRGKESWTEHRSIMAAIDAGNAAEAEKLMAGHVHQSRQGYLSRFASDPV
ncbi:DNA-binding GntR family transcriptional regulator [Arthrobacter pigmenti]|uniref:DNA-binding GntR family transcriptional regulator n=1 Tax=Arthrobacter pigmenti TaxID=271432 RepID=A0A846RR88_9MICC|nr:GntR family transcriptional regulator [Arthrobacter pigmenti]NJC21596.1 DNA-binding GntR family transcriptional regulator [Arthrobacter pigmenti]